MATASDDTPNDAYMPDWLFTEILPHMIKICPSTGTGRPISNPARIPIEYTTIFGDQLSKSAASFARATDLIGEGLTDVLARLSSAMALIYQHETYGHSLGDVPALIPALKRELALAFASATFAIQVAQTDAEEVVLDPVAPNGLWVRPMREGKFLAACIRYAHECEDEAGEL